jgi:hypothetical protein
MSEFEARLNKMQKYYLNEHAEKVKRRTTDQILDEGIGDFANKASQGLANIGTGVGKAVAGTNKAIQSFAKGAEKFNKAADDDPFGAVASGVQGMRDYGKTKGDLNLQNRIKSSWENMTSQQQSTYNSTGPLENVAMSDPKYSSWKGLVGFKRYQAEQQLGANDPSYAQTIGVTPTVQRQTQPSSNNQARWDQYIDGQWKTMDGSEKLIYGNDMQKFSQAEAARQRRKQQPTP